MAASSAHTTRQEAAQDSSRDLPDEPSNSSEKDTTPSHSPEVPQQADAYSFDGLTGWRKYRVFRPCRGMYHDIRRRLPYYWSDVADAWAYRTIASIVRMYFVNLLPAIAYLLDMNRRTGGFFGITEALFASALAAMVFSILGAQPLTIVGITGLISLFNYTIYDIIKLYDVSLYPEFLCWVGIWAAIFHWLVGLWNLCDYMRYVTDFSSQSFGMYVGIIYMIKGVEELVNEFEIGGATAGYLACTIAILYSATIYLLEKLGSSVIWNPTVRIVLADYSYVFATLFWVGFAHFPGRLEDSGLSFVPIGRAFYPTKDRDWLIHFWSLDVKWVFVAMPIGFLLMLLFYYDHVGSVFPEEEKCEQYHRPSSAISLKKPGGFHWDFFLLGCTTFVSAILGIPMPNGLVPQAPVHTDSLTVYETELRVRAVSDVEEPEIRKPEVRAAAVVEQRISHFVMGLAIIGTMSGPLLSVLHTMPTAVFAGVFFVVGWGSIESNGILQKLVFLMRERRFILRTEPLYQIRRRKIVLWISLQMTCVLACVAISQTIAAIGFPVLIIALIPLRTTVLPRWFTQRELDVLDDLTADNEVVLASLGGAPSLPKSAKLGAERRWEEDLGGTPRQRLGSVHR